MKGKKGFNLRSFTSFSLVFSTIIMSISGFILYIAPPGRIANWSDWKLMLFSKAEWQALHTIFSYMFFILFVIHLFFVNWKAFLTYIKSKIVSGLHRKWELAAATIITAIFFIGTLESWVPFGPVMTFGNNVKESWDKQYAAPPVAHMEEYNLEKILAEFPGATIDDLTKVLADSGITVAGRTDLLKKIAADNKTTPARIYGILTSRFKKDPAVNAAAAPSGVGRLTIKQVAERLGKPTEEIISILKENGVTATGETTMKTVADDLGLSPHDIYSMFSSRK
ncbi:MAG: DUF4405 domain-containing protein [Bacteroidales bacterium]